ncbi:hypothetical protein BT96DRAFT_980985 [Gymnopus androsaceus JB14]|uniref:Uncharacterized protein n=1 Tax=Gymnopus androsaceus JB14 TaxID=1447944 RepID=A0A6A4GT43_9AGAR|nr:hypothetical protein BT96DRAFT_980985 [Gymnopus androsaceus JB14]
MCAFLVLSTFMSILKGGRLYAVPASNIPKLHTLEPPTILPDYATQAGSHHPRSSASIAEKLLSEDNGDFLTRRLTLALEKGRIINVDRQDKTMSAAVAKFLVNLGVVDRRLCDNFHLEHTSNLICFSNGLHPLFETYGAFAYVPSNDSMDVLLDIVRTRNEVLQYFIDNVNPRRGKSVISWYTATFSSKFEHPTSTWTSFTEEIWSTFTYEIAILLPKHFLPFKQELRIRNPTMPDGAPPMPDEDLTNSTTSTADSTTSDEDSTMPDVSYIRTRVIKNELCIISTKLGTEPAIYQPFSHATKRDELNRVNPFFLCMNATDKYNRHCRKYGMETMSPQVNALFQKAVLIVALIYADFKPTPGSYGTKLKAERDED